MDDSNSMNEDIPKNSLLTIVNTIYSLLSINKEVKEEEALYSDEIYIEIISSLIPDLQDEITPGQTPEEKVEIIKNLLSLLNNLIEANLSDIDAEKLILEHDKESAKNFLELLLELISTLMNAGEEEAEEDEDNILGKHNISDGNINNKKVKSTSFEGNKKYNKEDEINIDNLESLKMSLDKKSENKKTENNKNEESEEMKIDGGYFGLDKEKSQSEENLIYNKEKNEDNKSNSKIMNSHISDEIKDKKIEDEDELNSNKKSYEIPALLEGEEKDTNKKNLEKEFNNDEEEISPNKIKYEENKFNLQNSEDDLSSNNLKEYAYSVPNPYNKPLLSNNNSSEDYGESRKNKNKKDDDDIDLNYNDELDIKDINKNSNTSLINSNISLHSKKSKNSNRVNDSKLQESSNKNTSSKKKESVLGGNNKASNKSSSKKGNKSNTNNSKNDNEIEEEITESLINDISKSSIYTIHEGSKASSGSKNSKKNKNSNLNKSKNSKKTSNKGNSNRSSCSTIINSEMPLGDQGFKSELVKELQKIYGNKMAKVLQGPNNSFSNLDLVIQELKMAKNQEKQMRMQQSSDSKDKNIDDKINEINSIEDIYLNKEFLIKNQKQIQQFLQMHSQNLKRRQNEQEKYIRDIGQNIQFMRKMKDYELKRLEDEIQRKKEMNVNNADEEVNFVKKVFDMNLQLEMNNCNREIESIKMINEMKEEEKNKNIFDIDRYYTDKIAILNEIGRREKKEKRRSKMEGDLIYEQLRIFPKKNLRKKLKQIINSMDDDYYNNVEVNNNNQEEIEKILDNYYKK